MKDMNYKGVHSSGHLEGMISKHGRKLDGTKFMGNVKVQNIMKDEKKTPKNYGVVK